VIPPTEYQMLAMYETMLKIRLFEEEILRREEKGLAIHSCAGHEAIAIGVVSQLKASDLVVSNHRPWGHFLAKGGNLGESFAEILGKPQGVCKGTGGEMGICKPEIGFVQSTMIVGACLTLASGVAMSIKMDAVKRSQFPADDEAIAVVFFGEGASTNGAFNEALTMAKLYELPLLFVCENNGLSGNTPSSEYMSSELVVHRASGYGFPTMVCDGSDVFAVWEAAQKGIDYIRKERGPYFLECLVARINRHKVPRMPDVRPPEVKRMARMRDPLLKLNAALSSEGILTPQADYAIRQKIAGELKEAIEFAHA
jgi:acetoin:2,6-dichlorophenolindophenol oxidoreductase subunit alpha